MAHGSTAAYRVAIVEDHMLQRRRTEDLVEKEAGLSLVFSGESGPELARWLRPLTPDAYPHLVLLDLTVDRQPSVRVDFVRALLAAGVRVVVLSALASPPLVREIVQAGVNGVVGKRDSEDDILAAIRAVLSGGQWMSPELATVIAGDPSRPKLSIQEERALILYASGLLLEEVATAMNLKPDTAKEYLDRVKAKYTAAGIPTHTKVDLTRIAWADGYVDPTLPRAPGLARRD